MMWNVLFSSLLLVPTSSTSFDISNINLPPEHFPYFFNRFPSFAKSCSEDTRCRFKGFIGKEACWGYESNCNISRAYHVRPHCPGDHRGWVQTKEAQYDTFHTQADFGMFCERNFPNLYHGGIFMRRYLLSQSLPAF